MGRFDDKGQANMIKRLKFLNCQPHKALEMQLSPGLNVIYGANDSGKSSLARCLDWQFSNKPRGDWMRRELKSGEILRSSVISTLDDDTVVKRSKGDDENSYELDCDVFNDFDRTGIPIEVQRAFGFDYEYMARFGKLLNVESEEDPAFLRFETAPQRAAIINYLTNVKIFDDCVKEATKETREIASEIKAVTVSIDATQNRITETDELAKFDLADFKTALSKQDKLSKEIGDLRGKADSMAITSRRLDLLEKKLAPADNAVKKLVIAQEEQSVVDYDLDELKATLHKWKTLSDVKEIPAFDFETMERLCKESIEIHKDLHDMGMLSFNIMLCNDTERITSETIEKNTSKLTKLLGDRCVLCGSSKENWTI